MISSTSDQQQQRPSHSVLATSAAAGHGLVHPLRRHSVQNMRLLKGSTAAVAAAAVTTHELPTKISLPTPSLNLRDEQEHQQTCSAASAPLPAKLMGDVAVATVVTFGVAPFLTVVDKAIVESANGSKPILASARNSVVTMMRHPLQYIKSPTFLLMWAVYSATYSTANAFKTLEEHQAHRQATATSTTSPQSASFQLGKVGTFLGTTMVNSGASIWKDRAYARMFSSSAATAAAAPTSFPKSTYAMWAMRDFSVIGSSFILPDICSQHLVQEYNMDAGKAQSLCQLTLPVAAQFVAGPFHFLGLDCFNRQHHSVSHTDRARALYQGIGPVVAARIARIAPGYGIGGVWNSKLRTAWRDGMVHRQEQRIRQTQGDVKPGEEPYFASLMRLLGGERVQGSLA